MCQEQPKPYRAYLLRCWQEGEASAGEEPAWRFSVEEVADEPRRKGFSSLEAVMAFFQRQLMVMPAQDSHPGK